ncbi:MAG: hypothetical protein EAZ61_06290, partial [Oscillatoriales cyanobacterium]
APYGYRRGQDRYTIDRQAAPVVRAFFERFSLYGSLSDVVRFLERQYGKRISTTTARRWLANPVYRGDLRYKRDNGKDEVIRNTHAPLISREEAAQIDRRLGRNKHLPPRTVSASRSLAGLVTCAACQGRFRITSARPYKTKTDRRAAREPRTEPCPHTIEADYTYLYPSNCPQQPQCGSLKYADVLTATIQQISEDLTRELERMAVNGLVNPSVLRTGLQAEVDRRQRILEQLPRLETEGILDAETVALRSYNLRVEMADLEQQNQQLPPVNLRETLATLSLPQFWYDLSEVERRFYLREFVRGIVIHRKDDRWWLTLSFAFGAPPTSTSWPQRNSPAISQLPEAASSPELTQNSEC